MPRLVPQSPLSTPPAPRSPKPQENEAGTLHLDDVDVRKALEILSREGSLNMLISPNVAGRVTASLNGLSPEQALEAILKLSNLVAQRENGVIYVYTREEMTLETGLPFRVYHLNYIRSSDVATMVKPLLSERGKMTLSPPSAAGIQAIGGAQPGSSAAPGAAGGAASGGGGGPTAGGDALAGGDVVIIQDRETVLESVDRLIAQLDVPPLQVSIEAIILSVELDKDREFGVHFGVVDTARTVLGIVGNGALLNATAGFSPLQILNPNPAPPPGAVPQLLGNAGQGFAADEHGLKFGFATRDVTGFLRALETIGKIEVLATPRLLVLNKQRAELVLGQRLGYSTFSQSVVSTVSQVNFLDVGTQLRVRPFISNDGLIRMEIHPERSTGVVTNNIPQTNTAEVTTNVMVPDGTTLVIGGLIDNMDDKQQAGMPILSDLPWIGVLFRQRQHMVTKRELVVLLTPRIWNPHGLPLAGPPVPPDSAPVVQTSAVQPNTPAAMPNKPEPSPLALTVPAGSGQVGQQLIYEIKFTNQGQKAVQSVGVTAIFPPGLAPIRAEGPTEHQIDAQQVVFQPLTSLEPHAQALYRLQVHALLSGAHRIRVRLQSSSLPEPLEAEGETRITPATTAATK